LQKKISTNNKNGVKEKRGGRLQISSSLAEKKEGKKGLKKMPENPSGGKEEK